MGRPPSNGGPSFRFLSNEVAEMEAILNEYHNTMPGREILQSLADKFSESPERKGKITVQMKQVWNWFQNRRYAIRAKSSKSPLKLNVTSMPRDDSAMARGVPQGPVPAAVPSNTPATSGRAAPENPLMEFEAKSARDGAWYDVGTFLSHRYLDTSDPEVLVRFAGFGPDEDEWLSIRKHVRQRSLPCEASECVAVLPGDLILCFQEGKDQALYFDAHVLDAQRRRHDVRGCRCRFLVRYDHDQSEEIVPLRKVCRRPETDYRLQLLNGANDSATSDQQKSDVDPSTVNALKVAACATETMPQKQQNAVVATAAPVSKANVSEPAKTTIPEPIKVEPSSAVNAGNPTVISAAGNPGVVPAAGNPGVVPAAAALTSSTAPSSGAASSGENMQQG